MTDATIPNHCYVVLDLPDLTRMESIEVVWQR